MDRECYLVSDLHFGGDGGLQMCDYADEFIDFLKKLAVTTKPSELILAGDTFGFWELTEVQGVAQLAEIIKHHQAIFEQLRLTGERVKITMMVGNHDYDLACEPEFAVQLKKFNIDLDTSFALVREISGRKVWIEHGQQLDPYNAATEYGNINALPSGFFITETFVSGASKYSVFGSRNWLKDIRSVDVRQIPDWLISNYFYREMNRFLRWLVFPFLFLLTVTALALLAQVLKFIGFFDVNVLLENSITKRLGLNGDILRWVIAGSAAIWLFIFAVTIPLYFIYCDIRGKVKQIQNYPSFKSAPTDEANNIYLNRARAVFQENPDVCAYVFGHTHEAFLIKEKGRVIINTGTWLKILRRVGARGGLLPAVYYPTFRLNYFKIYAKDERIYIKYVQIPKDSTEKLTILQRLIIFGRKPDEGEHIPAQTIL